MLAINHALGRLPYSLLLSCLTGVYHARFLKVRGAQDNSNSIKAHRQSALSNRKLPLLGSALIRFKHSAGLHMEIGLYMQAHVQMNELYWDKKTRLADLLFKACFFV